MKMAPRETPALSSSDSDEDEQQRAASSLESRRVLAPRVSLSLLWSPLLPPIEPFCAALSCPLSGLNEALLDEALLTLTRRAVSVSSSKSGRAQAWAKVTQALRKPTPLTCCATPRRCTALCDRHPRARQPGMAQRFRGSTTEWSAKEAGATCLLLPLLLPLLPLPRSHRRPQRVDHWAGLPVACLATLHETTLVAPGHLAEARAMLQRKLVRPVRVQPVGLAWRSA